jgi:hypothetical protein
MNALEGEAHLVAISRRLMRWRKKLEDIIPNVGCTRSRNSIFF